MNNQEKIDNFLDWLTDINGTAKFPFFQHPKRINMPVRCELTSEEELSQEAMQEGIEDAKDQIEEVKHD